MRFISRYARWSYEAIKAVEMPLPNGKLDVRDAGVICWFRNGNITEEEYETALKHFHFGGLPLEEDGLTPIGPRYRIGVYDTDVEARAQRWTDERKAEVEKALMEAVEHGESFILVTAPPVVAPWPAYDESVGPEAAAQIASLVNLTGADPELVLAYERENANRDDVVAAVEELRVPAEPEPEAEPAPDEAIFVSA